MAKKFTINIQGYWVGTEYLPKYSGIYFVYTCTHTSGQVFIDKLIYIGETNQKGGICARVSLHEKWDDWRSHLKEGQKLCFSSSEEISSDDDRLRIEAACIYEHKPIENIEHTNNFNYPDTLINLKGKISKLYSRFSITGYSEEPPVIFFD